MQDNERSPRMSTYPENVNYAIYELIWALGIVMFCLFTAVVLISHSSNFGCALPSERGAVPVE